MVEERATYNQVEAERFCDDRVTPKAALLRSFPEAVNASPSTVGYVQVAGVFSAFQTLVA